MTASTRPARIGRHYAEWFAQCARSNGALKMHSVDLRELNLPLMEKPRPPRFGDYQHEHTKQWAGTVADADAVVFVMPEYNFPFTAPLKNAIDYLF